MYFCDITGLRTYINFTFPCPQSHPTPTPYFKMLVLSKDQEMIPPVFVVDAHAQNFVLLSCYYSSLKHSHSALAQYMLLQWLDGSFCVQQQIGLLLLPVAVPPIVSSHPHHARHAPLPPPLTPCFSWFVGCACVPHYTASYSRIPSSECFHLDITIPSIFQNTK